MVGCRATHNFISMELVEKLGIPRVDTTGYGVLRGTRLSIEREGMFNGVVLT